MSINNILKKQIWNQIVVIIMIRDSIMHKLRLKVYMLQFEKLLFMETQLEVAYIIKVKYAVSSLHKLGPGDL